MGCAVLDASTAAGQDPVRPWLHWRTIETRSYHFHFPPELEEWTREVASRVESIDSVLVSIVGFSPPRPVQVVVDDPFRIPNGYVLPFIDGPVSVWWATPAHPRTDVGNYRSWGEMLAVHELAHVAHLTRPSRNPLQRGIWSSLSAHFGPIARKSPRWVYEGYATMIEGRVTGTGRPNSVWRPAMLRQWAIEGRLPAYSQMAIWDEYSGGDFAYMSGSAFLEWLARDHGDSALVHVWRRLTARRVRSFDASFSGVFGDGPQVLYERHTAEITRDAMAAKALLDSAGIVEGELVQRLLWGTGDPSISPDGKRVAVVLRERERPARLVVWSTDPEPEDTAVTRRRLREQRLDPLDVPDRRFYPRLKEPVKTLAAVNGRPFEQPSWMPDNRRVLLTRWTMRGDGTIAPDLYVWDVELDAVRRITRGAAVLHADPHPTANEALGTRCGSGRCDVVRVDLATGAVVSVLEGDSRRSYYRPRYSTDGRRLVVSVSGASGWRILVADHDGSNPRILAPDTANRYDARWLPDGDTLVLVSERGGIPNLELMSVADGGTRALTRVTGAALAPELDARDGSIWFLSLHSRGLDLRRLARDAAIADSTIAIASDRFGFAGVQSTNGLELRERTVVASKAYGAGPRHSRWLPGTFASGDGAGGFVTIYSGDIVGRFDAAFTGAYGEPGTMQGGAVRGVWRYPRPALELGALAFIHEPSRTRAARSLALTDTIDATLTQAVLATSTRVRGESWIFDARIGGAAGQLNPTFGGAALDRLLGFGDVELRLQQSRGSKALVEQLQVHGDYGRTVSPYTRGVVSLKVTTAGRDMLPIDLALTYGRVTGASHPFELFTVGGMSSPLADTALLAQRHSMPMLPTGVASGPHLFAWRAAFQSEWTFFYEGASTSAEPYGFRKWHRAVGIETRLSYPPVPLAFVPGGRLRAGVAYTLDAPFARRVRAYMEMRFDP